VARPLRRSSFAELAIPKLAQHASEHRDPMQVDATCGHLMERVVRRGDGFARPAAQGIREASATELALVDPGSRPLRPSSQPLRRMPRGADTTRRRSGWETHSDRPVQGSGRRVSQTLPEGESPGIAKTRNGELAAHPPFWGVLKVSSLAGAETAGGSSIRPAPPGSGSTRRASGRSSSGEPSPHSWPDTSWV